MKRVVTVLALAVLCACHYIPGRPLRMNDPSQASNATAFYRAGQTFVTWQQVAQPGVQYRVYRSKLPLRDAAQLTSETLLGQVHDYTALNLAASMNRLKFANMPLGQTYSLEQKVFFTIKDNEPPLTEGTGLFVHTAKEFGPAYYAVTAVINGQENRNTGNGNLTHVVNERVQPVEPVRQNETDYVHWTDNVGTPMYPAMSSLPSKPYNFRVHKPQGTGPFPLIGVLHGALFQYNTDDAARYAKLDGAETETAIRVALDSPVISTKGKNGEIKRITQVPELQDEPMTGWYGYNSNFGTGHSESKGERVDYTVRRVLWTLEWVGKKFPVDKDRVSLRGESMGGMGSIQIALLHPELFSAIHAYVPIVSNAEMQGKGDRPFAMPVNPPDYIQTHASQSFPFMMITAGRADHIVGWPWKINFAKILEQAQQGYILYWDGREHVYTNDPVFHPTWGEPSGRPVVSLTNFSRKQSYPAIAYCRANDDPGRVNFAVKPAERPMYMPSAPEEGDMVGTFNGMVDWDRASIVDQRGKYEIVLKLLPEAAVDQATAFITPRRTQNFDPYENSKWNYVATDASSGSVLAEGSVKAPSDHLIQIPNVPITKSGTRLSITKK